MQAASALFVKPPALAGTICGDGDGKGATVLAGIGHAAVDQDAVNAILNRSSILAHLTTLRTS